MLYSLNNQGWTDFNGKIDSLHIANYIKKGAKYLILNRSNDIDKEKIRYFLRNQIGMKETLTVYRL
jgi:hypothetical protein